MHVYQPYIGIYHTLVSIIHKNVPGRKHFKQICIEPPQQIGQFLPWSAGQVWGTWNLSVPKEIKLVNQKPKCYTASVVAAEGAGDIYCVANPYRCLRVSLRAGNSFQ